MSSKHTTFKENFGDSEYFDLAEKAALPSKCRRSGISNTTISKTFTRQQYDTPPPKRSCALLPSSDSGSVCVKTEKPLSLEANKKTCFLSDTHLAELRTNKPLLNCQKPARPNNEYLNHELLNLNNSNNNNISNQDRDMSNEVDISLRRVWAVIRIRPPAEERIPKEDLGISVIGPKTVKVFTPERHGSLSRVSERYVTYHADRVLGSSATQQQVWETVYPALEGIMHLDGCSVTVMAFGATGTGKTYTMLGEEPSFKSPPKAQLDKSDGISGCVRKNQANLFSEKGVIPRLFDALFVKLEESPHWPNIEIYVSNFEIYKEKIIDLFDTMDRESHSSAEKDKDRLSPNSLHRAAVKPLNAARSNLFFQRNPSARSSGLGLRWIHVKSREDLEEVLALGTRRRSKRQTRCNANSSRGHAIWQINIEKCEKNSRFLVGDFQFVDLAGAERSFSIANSDSTHIHEMASINKSLSSLAQCIEYLAKRRKRNRPFRDSKLTRFLAEKFKGRSQLVMIFTTSPFLKHYRSSLLTLQLVRAVLSSSIYTMPPIASQPVLLSTSKPADTAMQNQRGTSRESESRHASDSIECLHHIIQQLWKENKVLRRQLDDILATHSLPFPNALDDRQKEESKRHDSNKICSADSSFALCYKALQPRKTNLLFTPKILSVETYSPEIYTSQISKSFPWSPSFSHEAWDFLASSSNVNDSDEAGYVKATQQTVTSFLTLKSASLNCVALDQHAVSPYNVLYEGGGVEGNREKNKIYLFSR